MVSSRNKRLAAVAITVLLVMAGVGWWRVSAIAQRARLAQSDIAAGLQSGDLVSARGALSGLADPALKTAKEHEIRVAEIKQALETRDTGMLRVALGGDTADWIDQNLLESADLELAREAVFSRDFTHYEMLRDQWKPKTSMLDGWLLLEADQWVVRKQPEKALEFLKSVKLTGARDGVRHARIALLEAGEPAKAMESLDHGLRADPHNADLLSFRAQIEEAAGRVADARLDYVAAVMVERKNPLHREMLANFYLRRGELSLAAETWRDTVEDTGLGVYALKSWFWSRVSGVALSKVLPPVKEKGWKQLAAALAVAPKDVFWDAQWDDLLVLVPGGDRRPEVMWLKVLESLRVGDWDQADKQLDSSFTPEAERMLPGLAMVLNVHLHAMTGRNPRLCLAGKEYLRPLEGAHPWMVDFYRWSKDGQDGAVPAWCEAWMARPEAVVGSLFAAGWPGAAVMVGKGSALPPPRDAPDWFDYGYAKSLLIQGDKQAVGKWLSGWPHRTIPADLLLGEIFITTGEVEKGSALLDQISAGTSEYAERASWTLALMELDRGNVVRAREVATRSGSLAKSVAGRELFARIALAEGRRDETTKIYRELGTSSADAMIFLAKECYAAGDFVEARKWTGELARQFPDEPEFRRNLLQIEASEQRAKP